MHTAVNLPPFTDPETLVGLAVEAEEAGWDGVLLWDHMVLIPDQRLDVQDPWVLLGAMAARTERVRLGTLVTPLARRRPWVVARHMLTLDHLSGGRAVLGVGVGEPGDADFAAFGDPAGRRERAAVLDEALSLLDGLWRGPVEHRGEHFTVTTELLPRPVQQPRPPIWVAAIAPHRRPVDRALRWDGIAPLSGESGPITPEQLDAYLADVDRPEGWDVVATWVRGVPVAEYEDAGATWLVEGAWPVGDWVAELRDRIRSGP
jgi:alkanesulfonate monooxygenase SsuD/methylene tetrahydromethanopterin reductase-like flavin-dependent oxidoreductase (luciferase family)